MANHFTARELATLRVLREAFLSFEEHVPGEPAPPYWDSAEELALYDRTFGERIGWKWDAVLAELRRRGRLPGGETLLDWGCGSGVAARRLLAARPGFRRAYLWDHSRVAMEYAAERLAAQDAGLEVALRLPDEGVDVLLVSHVLDELPPEALEPLLDLARRAAAVVWVEPGSRRTARALGAVRARLAETLDVLAPCTHQADCGVLADERGWCHSFARPPRAAFTEGSWTEFGRELGIDLRSLPYSFLALARRGSFELAGPAARILGRPRITRGRAEFDLCDASGVARCDTLQRSDKKVFKELEASAGEGWLCDVTREGTRVTGLVRRDG